MVVDLNYIPKGWKKVKIPKVLFFQEGPGVRNWQFTETGVKLLNVGNINNGKIDLSKTSIHLSNEEANGKYEHFLVDDGDLLIACSGIVVDNFHNKIAFAEKEHLPLCLNTSTMRFKALNDEVDLNYFKYYLQTVHFTAQLRKLITGSAQLNFGPSHIKKIDLLLPPLETQRHIARILDDAAALRKKTEQLIIEYDALAQSIFLDMFGDPIKNEKNWEKVEISKLTTKVQKINKDYKYRFIDYIDISSINNVKFRIESTTEYKIDERPSRAQQILKKDDVLISTVRPNLKNVAMNKVDGLIASTGFYVCRVNNKLSSKYIFEVLKSESITNYFVQITSGANYPAIKSSDITKLPVSLPPISLQNEFAEKITLIEQQKELAEDELKESEDLFNCLLQKAFKGELM